MLTAIIGSTASGKSTLAARIADHTGAEVISAGQWIRAATGCQIHGAAAAEKLGEESRQRLSEDPTVGARSLSSQAQALRAAGHCVVVEGLRNPVDLVALLRRGDRVIDLGGEGLAAWEREGLAACRRLRPCLEEGGVTWSPLARHFAWLPVALEAVLDAPRLGVADHPLQVEITALESYEGQAITALVKDRRTGGTLHDVPLDYLNLRPDTGLGGAHCYGIADRGPPVFETTPEPRRCQVFRRDRTRWGEGHSLGVLHWPQGNTLLHLVITSKRGWLLWPPHKLLFTADPTAELPWWSKNRTAPPPSADDPVATIDRLFRAVDLLRVTDDVAADTARALLSDALARGVPAAGLLDAAADSCRGAALREAVTRC